MAIMIQPLIGERHGRYFFPPIVGTGWSKNPFQQQTGGRKEDGCLRLVWGFADRINSERPDQQSCLIALGHTPRLSPASEHNPVQANQQNVKVVNLETNQFEMIPITELLHEVNLPGGYGVTAVTPAQAATAVITFHTLTQDARFIKLMRQVLQRLQTIYDKPVELEFTLLLENTPAGPRYKLYILQCHTGQSVIGNR